MDNFNDDLYPLALLMDELKHDDVANRVQAMRKVDTIAMALGPERTVNELLPFLHDVAQDDEEEVFAELGTKLGSFVPLVGGHQHCEPVIQILLILVSMEEPIVRDKAIVSLNLIADELNDEELHGIFLPMVSTLSLGNWFLKKVAACGLFKSIIRRVNEETRHELLQTYLKLLTDDSPMVRRAAASNLPAIIEKLDGALPADWDVILAMFHHLVLDDQDSVKFLSVDVLVAILARFRELGDDSHNSQFLASVLALIGDASWRVRYTAADRFGKLATNFGDAELAKLVDPFVSLMKDNEGEVRKAIARQLPDFCEFLANIPDGRTIIVEKIVPVVAELAEDPHEAVRAAAASKVTGLAPILGKEATIEQLLPIFLVMLKDEFPEVRLNVISSLSVVNSTIGVSLLSTHLLPAITELAQDSKWRVRLAIIEYIPKLADQLGVSFFNSELLSLCMLWLWDPVFAIRDAAVNNLKELIVIFGSEWANREIISRLLHSPESSQDDQDQIDYSNFVIRLTCLFTATKIIPVVDFDIVVSSILPFVNHLVNDSVPNIRFNVAKLYLVLAETFANSGQPNASSIVSNDILPKLEKLQSDEDVDVRFYASRSIQGIENLALKAN